MLGLSGIQHLRMLYARDSQHVATLFYLQQQLDSLDRSDSSFGDGSGDSTGQEVLHETDHRVRHGCRFLVQTRDPRLFQTSHWSSRKPNAPSSGRGSSICPNISAPFIARILSDGFGSGQTEKRGWINIRGRRLRPAPYWCPLPSLSRGRLKGTIREMGLGGK